MKLKTIAIATGALLAVAVLVALLRDPGGERREVGRSGQPVLLPEHMENVAKFRFDNGEDTATIRSAERGWVIEEEFDFPVEQRFLRQFLLKLSELRLERRITDKPEVFPELGVLRPSENGGKREENRTGIEFTVIDADGEAAFRAVFGNRRRSAEQGGAQAGVSGSGGMYMRDLADDTVYIISGAPRIFTKSREWIKAVILDFKAKKDLKRFRIQRANGEVIAVERIGEPPEEVDFKTKVDWRLDGVEDISRLDQRVILEIAKGLGDLFLVRVSDPSLSPKETGRERIAVVNIELFDRRHFTVTLGEELDTEDFRQLTIEATLDPSVDDPELRKETEEFNRIYKGRIFVVHSWVATRILPDREEYFVEDG
ncbi:MAG: DUF4340 domain-containing protein [SAR324 cluster bacterium]|nr:DUF4340 domain-containing protein [SAR324 cluster bacterium]